MIRTSPFALRLLTAATVILSAPAHAQGAAQKLRPGLWEHGFTMKSQSGQLEAGMKKMQDAMAQMTPQQRKQMQDMMASQGVGMTGGSQSVKLCLSKEDAERDVPLQQDGCDQKVKRSGNVWQITFQCKGPPPSSGEGQMTLASPTAYSGSFLLLTEVDGKPERMQMTQTGKWLAADCGAIRPIAR
jgi:hypothetical protein